MENHNPFLAAGGIGGNKGGGRFVEDIATVENIVWQTRCGDLDAGEEAFAAALSDAFASGADSLEACAAELNRQGLSMSTAMPWTAESLGKYLAHLSQPSL